MIRIWRYCQIFLVSVYFLLFLGVFAHASTTAMTMTHPLFRAFTIERVHASRDRYTQAGSRGELPHIYGTPSQDQELNNTNLKDLCLNFEKAILVGKVTEAVEPERSSLTYLNFELPFSGTYLGLHGIELFHKRLRNSMELTAQEAQLLEVHHGRGVCIIRTISTGRFLNSGKTFHDIDNYLMLRVRGNKITRIRMYDGHHYRDLIRAYRTPAQQHAYEFSRVLHNHGYNSTEFKAMLRPDSSVNLSHVSPIGDRVNMTWIGQNAFTDAVDMSVKRRRASLSNPVLRRDPYRYYTFKRKQVANTLAATHAMSTLQASTVPRVTTSTPITPPTPMRNILQPPASTTLTETAPPPAPVSGASAAPSLPAAMPSARANAGAMAAAASLYPTGTGTASSTGNAGMGHGAAGNDGAAHGDGATGGGRGEATSTPGALGPVSSDRTVARTPPRTVTCRGGICSWGRPHAVPAGVRARSPEDDTSAATRHARARRLRENAAFVPESRDVPLDEYDRSYWVSRPGPVPAYPYTDQPVSTPDTTTAAPTSAGTHAGATPAGAGPATLGDGSVVSPPAGTAAIPVTAAATGTTPTSASTSTTAISPATAAAPTSARAAYAAQPSSPDAGARTGTCATWREGVPSTPLHPVDAPALRPGRRVPPPRPVSMSPRDEMDDDYDNVYLSDGRLGVRNGIDSSLATAENEFGDLDQDYDEEGGDEDAIYDEGEEDEEEDPREGTRRADGDSPEEDVPAARGSGAVTAAKYDEVREGVPLKEGDYLDYSKRGPLPLSIPYAGRVCTFDYANNHTVAGICFHRSYYLSANEARLRPELDAMLQANVENLKVSYNATISKILGSTKLDEESLYYIELHRAVPISHTFYRMTFDDDGKLVNMVVGPVKPPLTLDDLHRSQNMRNTAIKLLKEYVAPDAASRRRYLRQLEVDGKDLGFRIVVPQGKDQERLRRLNDRMEAYMRKEQAARDAEEREYERLRARARAEGPGGSGIVDNPHAQGLPDSGGADEARTGTGVEDRDASANAATGDNASPDGVHAAGAGRATAAGRDARVEATTDSAARERTAGMDGTARDSTTNGALTDETTAAAAAARVRGGVRDGNRGALRGDRPMATMQASAPATPTDHPSSTAETASTGASADASDANADTSGGGGGGGGGAGIAALIPLSPRQTALIDVLRTSGDRGYAARHARHRTPARDRNGRPTSLIGRVHASLARRRADAVAAHERLLLDSHNGRDAPRTPQFITVRQPPSNIHAPLSGEIGGPGNAPSAPIEPDAEAEVDRGGALPLSGDEGGNGKTLCERNPHLCDSIDKMKMAMSTHEVELGHLFVDGRPSRRMMMERMRLLRNICREHGLGFYDIVRSGVHLRPGHVLCHQPLDPSVSAFLHYDETNLIDNDVNDVCDADDSYNSLDCLRRRNRISALAHTEPSALSYKEATAAIHGLGLDKLAQAMADHIQKVGYGCYNGTCTEWGDVGGSIDAKRCRCVQGCMKMDDLDSLADEFGTWRMVLPGTYESAPDGGVASPDLSPPPPPSPHRADDPSRHAPRRGLRRTTLNTFTAYLSPHDMECIKHILRRQNTTFAHVEALTQLFNLNFIHFQNAPWYMKLPQEAKLILAKLLLLYRLQWRNEVYEEMAYTLTRDPRSIVFNEHLNTNTMEKLKKEDLNWIKEFVAVKDVMDPKTGKPYANVTLGDLPVSTLDVGPGPLQSDQPSLRLLRGLNNATNVLMHTRC